MATEFLNAVRVRPYCFIPPDPSVRFRIFFRVRVRMSVILTVENPKIGKIGAEIHASVYEKPRSLFLLEKCYEVLKVQAM